MLSSLLRDVGVARRPVVRMDCKCLSSKKTLRTAERGCDPSPQEPQPRWEALIGVPTNGRQRERESRYLRLDRVVLSRLVLERPALSAEPGDWSLLRKIKMPPSRTRFVDKPLVYHYGGSEKEAFVAQLGEAYLE